MKEFDHISVIIMNTVALTGMGEWMTRILGQRGIKWDTEVTRGYYPQLTIVMFESDKYKTLFDMKWESEYSIHASAEAAIHYWANTPPHIPNVSTTVIAIARNTKARTQIKIQKGEHVVNE